MRQHAHRQRDARQHCLQPIAPQGPEQAHQQQAQRQSDTHQFAGEPLHLLAQGRRLQRYRVERLADATQFGVAPHGRNLQQTLAADHQRARKHRVAGLLGDGLGFTGQHRFVGGQLVGLQQRPVGGDAVALGNHQQVFPHHIAACNTHGGAAPQGQRARAGEVAQGAQGVVGAAFLQHGEGHDDHHEAQKNQGFVCTAHDQVHRPGTHEQQEHGFTHHVPGHVAQRAALADTQFIGPLVAQTLRCDGGIETGGCLGGGHG